MLCAVLFSGCNYPEGPFISFIDPEERVYGYWYIGHTYLNGEEITETDIYTNCPGSYYTFMTETVLSITAYYEGFFSNTPMGHWTMKDDEKTLVVDYSFKVLDIYYEATIMRLTDKELFYEYDDEDGNHWRLELFSRY